MARRVLHDQPRRHGVVTALLAASCLLAAIATASDAPVGCKGPARYLAAADRDPLTPRPPYDVQRYDLDLRIDPDAERIDGTVTVTVLFPDDAADREVVLDLVDGMAATSVTWNGDDVPFVHADDLLTIVRTGLPPAQREAELRIAYGGEPQRHGELFLGFVFRMRGPSPSEPLGQVMFNVSQPSSSRSWWPCKDDPGDKALVRTSLTVPDTLTAVANGLQVADAPSEPGWRRTTWESRYPLPPYLVGVAVSEYVAWEEDCPGAATDAPLTYHVFPEDVDVAETFFAPTCAMLDLMEDVAGPYPFGDERYGQTEAKWGGGMEHQTSTTMGRGIIHGGDVFAGIIVHELAHQWFGDLITPRAWNDIWLNEGFATYCEALWLERSQGPAAYRELLLRYGPTAHPDLFTESGILTDPSPILSRMVYDKGAWLLHMLRGETGDDVFFDILASWTAHPDRRYAHATTDDFVAHCSTVAGRDLGPWFHPWLETADVPELEWSWRAVPASDGGTRLHVEVAQLQETLFPVKLPVMAVAGTDTSRLELRLDGRSVTAAFDLDVAPTTVLLDPEMTVLHAAAALPPPELTVTGVMPNPVGADGAAIAFRARSGGAVSAALYDARGRRLGSWDLGEREADAVGSWRWRADDGDGRPVAAGAYWLELRSAAGRTVERLTVIR